MTGSTGPLVGVWQRISGILHFIQQGWERFWFSPADPVVLCFMRVLVGGMLLYTHIVWGLNLEAFLATDGWNSPEVIQQMQAGTVSPSFWWYVPDAMMWPVHWTCLSVLFLFWIGCCTRITSVLSFLICMSYSYRAQMANFGLDQINGLLCLYLCVGPSGSLLSVDRWWQVRQARRTTAAAGHHAAVPGVRPSPGARLALRLIQVHFCVIYGFAGLSKLQGDAWWNGEAVWLAFSNLEYQSVDMTWIAWYPWISDLATHATIVWEVFFPALIWIAPLRPLMLLTGFLMHLGIGGLLGMWTFGLIMIFGHVAFWSPSLVRRLLSGLPGCQSQPGSESPSSGCSTKQEKPAMNLLPSFHRILPLLLVTFCGCAERIDSFEEYLELAWHHERAGNQQQAIAAYQQALALDPVQPVAWYDLGVLYEAAGQPEQAVHAWTQALTHDPNYSAAFVNRGTILARQGSKELALEDFSRAITAAPSEFAPRRNRADLHRELQNIPEALADFSEALRINPRDAETWLERGLLRRELNDWNRALVDFEQATELDPGNATAWLQLAHVAARLGLTAVSETAQQRALELDPQQVEQHLKNQQPATAQNAPTTDPVAAAGFQ